MGSAICAVLLVLFYGEASAGSADWQSRSVTASAYNSVPAQTTAHEPALAAWGDVLEPGMHALAVSRDLIRKGLTYGTRVKIDGLSGVYVVLDKMAARWSNKIDIYMGEDTAKARDWGVKRNIRIQYAENVND